MPLLGGSRGGGCLGLNRPQMSPRGVPGHVLVLKTYQDILQKCLWGLVVISEILQFRPSGPGPHGLIWSYQGTVGSHQGTAG